MTIVLIITGIILLPVVYNLLFPFKKPNLENYFKPGQSYYSKAEGIRQTVIRQEKNKVYCELNFEPFAVGPPEHLHVHFDETATVKSGTLTIKVNGNTSSLKPGERIVFKKGVYHQMRNETNEEVIIISEKEEDFVPVEFAYSLSQLYPLMNKPGGASLKLFARICVLDHLFDSVIAGPPPLVFQMIKKIVKPYARIFGVRP